MMISLDTNVVFSLINPHDTRHAEAQQRVGKFASEGFSICPVVYAELRASEDWEGINLFLQKTGLEPLWEMPDEVWDRAGDALGRYARARREGSLPRRIVGDFLIAAHAEHHALDVLTFDETIYKAVFPKLKLRS